MAEFLSEYALALTMIATLLIGIFSGYPVAFLLGGLGIVFASIGGIPIPFLGTVGSRIFGGVIENWLMIAIPLFVFMGLMLERSGVAKRLLLTLQRLFGRTHGGLAVSVALLGVVMAATTASEVAELCARFPMLRPPDADIGTSAKERGYVMAEGPASARLEPSPLAEPRHATA